ncbi:MAG: glyoxalase [Gemmatimonadaceae bacterium]|nr:glyoxalase [Gemmatimonadaceae bacterium]
MSLAPKLYVCLSYRDPDAAIEFLTRAFGFTEHFVVRNEEGRAEHTQLAFGDEIIMLGRAKQELGWVSPLDLPAVNATVCCYVADPDALHIRATNEGAVTVRAPYDTDYGARECSVRDVEGHQWHFSTYRPSPSTPT